MTELREVFEMATKQMHPPHQDSLKEQERRQRRASTSKKYGAIAVAAAIGLVVVVAVIASQRKTAEAPQPAPSVGANGPAAVPRITGTDHVMFDLETGGYMPLPKSLAGGYSYNVSPDGTRFAYDQEIPELGINGVYVANVDGSGVSLVSPDGLDAISPEWSADGSKLVFMGFPEGASAGKAFVLDLRSGTTTQVTDAKDVKEYWFLYPTFGPDGDTILYQYPRSTFPVKRDLLSVPITGGSPTLVRRNAGLGVYSPDGSEIAYLPAGPDFGGTSIAIAGIHPADPTRTLVEDLVDWFRWSPDGGTIAYGSNGEIFAVNVATGERTEVASDAYVARWFDDHTLVIGSTDSPRA